MTRSAFLAFTRSGALRRALVALAAAATLAACGGGRANRARALDVSRSADGAEYRTHEVIVQRKPSVDATAFAREIDRLGGEVVDEGDPLTTELGFVRIVLPDSIDADQAILRLMDAGVAERAERNWVIHIFRTPSDPRYGELWGMPKIGAPAAWDVTTGSADVLVAVTDTGVDYNHADLKSNVWNNAGEIAGNGKDDDGNGFVDDVRGYDFINNDGDPLDDHGHGSHVSGTIGASANDGVGVAGVNWTVRLMGLKMLSASGSGSMWAGAQAVLYAAKMKARVVNASWGCTGPSCYASYLEQAIQKLADAGGLFVAAAGNNYGNNNDNYPAYPANYAVANVLSVAATDAADNLASFSNFGPTKVHLAAPGVGILSTVPGGGYASWNGTSMATPHVAGAAALYLSRNPTATFAEVRAKLLSTATPVAGLAGKVASGGRLDVAKLIKSDTVAPAAPSGVRAVAGQRNEVTVSWDANAEPDLAGYRVRWGTQSGQWLQQRDVLPAQTSLRLEGLAAGARVFIVVQAFDGSGNVSATSTEVGATPVDASAPPPVIDLVAVPMAGEPASLALVDASGESSAYWAAAHAVDGDPTTSWLAPPRPTPQEEHLVAGLLVPKLVDRIEILPSAVHPELFPSDVDVEIAETGVDFQPVGGVRGAVASAGQPIVVVFPATWTSAVRLRVVRGRQHTSGLFYTAIGELTVREASRVPDGLELRFTAPGDDPGAGLAARYDVRVSTSPIDEATFANAQAVTAPPPAVAGVQESFVVTGLPGGRDLWVALKAIDDAGNVSALSNVARARTATIPPATITDLRASAAGPGSITLAWTSVGEDGRVGQAQSYDVRVSPSPITPANVSAATSVPGAPTPQPAGATETLTLTNLAPDAFLYFAVRAVDASGTPGGVSNVVQARAQDGPDTVPPAAVTDLRVFPSQADAKLAPVVVAASSELSTAFGAAKLLDGDPNTAWVTTSAAPTTPAWVVLDLGSAVAVNRLRMNAGLRGPSGWFPVDFDVEASTDQVAWQPIVSVRGLLQTPGAWGAWGTEPTTARYLRLRVLRRAPEEAGSVSVWIGELEVYALTPQLDLDLSWVAPGDDGFAGTATRYDLRRAQAPITADTFAQATPVATLAPLPGGQIELHHHAALPLESVHWFALTTIDDAGNTSALSNAVRVETPGVPPAPIADLAVANVGKTSVTLTFKATGDDGMVGTASAYEVRYARAPITPATWGEASAATTPAPGAPGTRETVTVSGLSPNTIYFFAAKVVDDHGARSLVSNLVSAETLDGTPPRAVADLVATAVDPGDAAPFRLRVAESSGAYGVGTTAENLLDDSAATAWVSPARAVASSELVRFDLGGARKLGRLRLRAATGYTDLFPATFQLEARNGADAPWTVVVAETGFVASGDDWEEWALGSVSATEARLVVAAATRWAGSYVAALGDLALFDDDTDGTRVRLAWTAPGDDDDRGTAAAYDVRRANAPIGELDFAAATAVTGVAAPQPAGSLERLEVTGLAPETRHCFALVSVDDVGQSSPVSSSPCVTTPGLPPSTVVDLRVTAVGATTATLTWTAPGADGTRGQAKAYELRYAASRINGATWNAATRAVGVPAPSAAGATETFTVTGLASLTNYHFAVRAIDDAGNLSAISNGASARTADGIPPGRVTNLVATTDATAGGAVTLAWTAPGDNGATGQAARYDVRVSTSPIDDGNFANAAPVPASTPKAGGSGESLRVTGLGAETAYHFALKAIDAAGNVGPLSNVATARTREEPPSAVTDLAIVGGRGAASASLDVQWTAPGSDGTVGTAARYDLRVATSALDATTFAAATQVADAPAPAAPGTVQRHTITGLAPGQKYWVALVTYDARGNASKLSNVATSSTPDEVPPARISTLLAQTGASRGTVTLTWIATGDDGTTGSATAYELRWSRTALDEATFANGTLAAGPTPAQSGTKQTHTLSGLPDEDLVYVALRARDDAGNVGPVSNVATARTPDVAPATVADLRQAARTGTSITVAWTAPGDDGATGTANAYDLRIATTPITVATFAAATRVTTPAPSAGGRPETLVIAGLAPTTAYYVALKTSDERGNTSGLSNVLAAETLDQGAPGGITNLAAKTGASSGSITLTWTAPGDDGSSGRAAKYEVRRAGSAITAETWASATVVSGAPTPQTAGSAETFTVSGLAGETAFFFALRAVDEAGNAGPISNGASAMTPAVPPAAVTDLVATASAGAVTLTWTAPGDDDRSGRASVYEIRYAQSPINAANFANATAAGSITPSVAGSKETLRIAGLAESTTYHFALRAQDDVGAWSALSNLAKATTPDLTKPGAPSGLAVSAPTASDSPLVAIAATATSTLGASWDADHVIDGIDTTAWASMGAAEGATETLSLDFGQASSIDRIRLLPDAFYPGLFPRDFALETSTDGKTWSVAAIEDELTIAGTPAWLSWGFPARDARHVRLVATGLPTSFDRGYAIVAEAEVLPAAPTDGRALLSFIAPGDDGLAGTAKAYQIYRHTQPFDAGSLAGATLLASAPAPLPAGSLQSTLITGLAGETTYHWAVRAIDDAGNVGALSNVVAAKTNPVAPAAVQDLSARALGTTSVELRFTAPGDDGQVGTATRYEIRHATYAITSQNFALATKVANAPAPAKAGTAQTLTVGGLEPGRVYRFALVARDEEDNASYLSNVAVVVTTPAPDVTAPAAVTNLAARLPTGGGQVLAVAKTTASSEQLPGFPATAATDGSPDTMWASAARDANQAEWVRVDLGARTRLDRVRVWPSGAQLALFPRALQVRTSPDGLAFTTAATLTGYAVRAGAPVEARFAAAVEARYVEVQATELALADNGLRYAVIAEVEAWGADEPRGTVLFAFAAPSDDGPTGRAATYELRAGTCPFSAATAARVATPAPQTAGTPELARATGLPAGQVCAAVRSTDAAGNVSAWSNVATIDVP